MSHHIDCFSQCEVMIFVKREVVKNCLYGRVIRGHSCGILLSVGGRVVFAGVDGGTCPGH